MQPTKATPCPHPMHGTRLGSSTTPEVMEQGGGASPAPSHLPGCRFRSVLCVQGRAGVRAAPKPAFGARNRSHPLQPWGSSASLGPMFPGEHWAGWGSQEAAGPRWSQRPRHPSSLSAPLAAGRALAAGPHGERQAGGSGAISHATNKNNWPGQRLQSAGLKFMWLRSPRGCWEDGGSPQGGTWAGCTAVVHACGATARTSSADVIGMLARGETCCPALGTTQ